jgi:hypothetical protein
MDRVGRERNVAISGIGCKERKREREREREREGERKGEKKRERHTAISI